MILNPGSRLGPYEIEALVGVGGMGEVYRGTDRRLKRSVAIKVLLPSGAEGETELRAQFQHEARAIASLSHPHVCALYDIGQEGLLDFLVMEYLEGETLAARLAKGALPVDGALRCGIEMAEALDAAHRQGLVHRDLKPSNIMMTKLGAKLLDFGLAKLNQSSRAAFSEDVHVSSTQKRELPVPAALVGTLPYMAPEVLEGKEADNRTDLFSFGVVLYEMLTGTRAFERESPARLVSAILNEQPPPISSRQPLAPPALERVVSSCLAKDRDQRWQSAGDLVQQLKWIAEGNLARLRPRPFWKSRRVQAVAAAAVVAVAAAAGVARFLNPRPAGPTVLVVLPCRAIGSDPADQMACDGLAETLAARLSKLAGGVLITPASEVRKEKVDNVDQARVRLGAKLALEGSWHRVGDTVRVNYVLVDARTHRQVDALSFTAAAGDPFSVQDRVVAWAAAIPTLKLELPERQAAIPRGTEVPEAYDLYLPARGYLQNYYHPPNVDKAISLFNLAIARDSRFALAYAGLGKAYWHKFEIANESDWIDSARRACAQAAAIDPDLAEAHVCLGTVHRGTGQYKEAVDAFERALLQDPATDDAWLGLAQAHEAMGDSDSAEATYRQAIDARPDYWAAYTRLASFYRTRGRFEEAVDAYERVLVLTPDNAAVRAGLGAVYTYLGRYEDAVEAFRTSMEIEATYQAYANLGMTYFRMRQFDDAEKMLLKATEMRPSVQSFAGLARTYYWAGKRAQALELYERAIQWGTEQLKINPADADAHLSLADCNAKLGRRQEAVDHLTRVDVRDNWHLLFFVGLVYSQLGEAPSALHWLGKAAERGLPRAELFAWPELDKLSDNPEFVGLTRRQYTRE